MYVVINGGGKVGEHLAGTLLRHKHDVAIIERDEKTIERLALDLPSRVLMIHGDGCDSAFQSDAGAGEADIFVATTGSDDTNLVSCEIASLVFSIPRIIARVSNPKNERIFRRIGIEAVSSTTIISRLIESEATEGAVHAVMSLTQGDLVITEVTIPRHIGVAAGVAKRAQLNREAEQPGCRVADIALPEGSLLVAVGRGEALEIVKGSTQLYPGDAVICVSKQGLEDAVRDALLALAF
ncbi:MAG: TrkA family potassium uptake protein [Coriobacteriales bacterium]|jgi:trk system potassium uptake protein TrkA|nr:TrkA family potassium uptake protein [Coriobacteriales bacterium]